MSREVVVLLDSANAPIGTYPKDEVHSSATPYHLAFSSYLLDANARVLITRRSLSKKAWPGVWTNSACGHPAPGETFEDACRRRGSAELGVDVQHPRIVLPEFSYRAVDASGIVEWEFCPVLVGDVVASTIDPNPDEVSDYAWVEAARLLAAVDATPEVFSPWMVEQLHDKRLRSVLANQ